MPKVGCISCGCATTLLDSGHILIRRRGGGVEAAHAYELYGRRIS